MVYDPYTEENLEYTKDESQRLESHWYFKYLDMIYTFRESYLFSEPMWVTKTKLTFNDWFANHFFEPPDYEINQYFLTKRLHQKQDS